MTLAQIRSVALFLFFALLDEERVERASKETLLRCRKRLHSKYNRKDAEAVAIIVYETTRELFKSRKQMPQTRATLNSGMRFVLPQGLSFGAWRQFQKESSPEELVATIWISILGLPEESVARGLGITIGTLRFRVAQGQRALGRLLVLGEFHA